MANRIPDERAGGGMTGATGNLTPDNANEDFVPAETRELTDPLPRPTEESEADQSIERGGAGLGGDERREPEDEHL
jgi:hypothetical protein